MRALAESGLQQLLQHHSVAGHGFDHMVAVANHAVEALKVETLTLSQTIAVELAALLHDADDEKIFPNQSGNMNARKILQEIGANDVELIIEMINLVACSKNGDMDPPEPFMAIPRDCDRLEAIGEIGIIRCIEFTNHKGSPCHLETTPRVRTIEELSRVATSERFRAYSHGGKSSSMIDHYYDKLLHIGQPSALKSKNSYILSEAAKRNEQMIHYVFDYWKTQDQSIN